MTKHGILDFLKDLSENNNRNWLLAHKDAQKAATAQFEELVQNIVDKLAEEEPALAPLRAKDITYRLNRDVRFSHDKSPYHPAFRAHISPGGKLPVPVGYFLHIAPGNIFLGGGLFASVFTDATLRVRNYLAANGQAFLDIVNSEDFQKDFVLIGEKLKNVPRGFDPTLPAAAYLKHKSWAIERRMADDSLADLAAFQQATVETFRRMRPFNSYLNRALAGFQMPERKASAKGGA